MVLCLLEVLDIVKEFNLMFIGMDIVVMCIVIVILVNIKLFGEYFCIDFGEVVFFVRIIR